MSSIDERIVQMQFNNSQFEKGIKESIKSLNDLKEGLDLESSAKELKKLQKAGDSFSLAKMAEGIESISRRFSLMGIVGQRVISNLADTAYYKGKRLISSLSVDQVTAGWVKYGQKTASVQTIMNATGKTIDEVNGYLDKLMWFSDETSYGFTDMTQALGQLTSAGGDVGKLIPMIEGIANATAFAGKGTGEFSRAIYNLNQSYSAGYLQYMDWKSLELAGIASKQLKQEFINAGIAAGTLSKEGKAAGGELVTLANFGQTLNKRWATTDVMERAFGKFAEMTEKAYELVQSGQFDTASDAYAYLATQYDDISITAAKAAQEAKTFTEAIDATKDAVSSGWMKTFELIFGNYDQAKVMWTDLANYLWDIFASGGESRNSLLEEWGSRGGRDNMLSGIYDMFDAIKNILDAVKAAIAQVIPPITVERLLEISEAVKEFGASFKSLMDITTTVIKKPSEMTDEIDVLGGFIPKETKKVKSDIEELERTINRGMSGEDVKRLQQRLKDLGYDIGSAGVDGIYGPRTQAALKKFQEDYGLAIDGIYGKASHAKLSELLTKDVVEDKKLRVAGKEIIIYSDTLKTLQKIVRGIAAFFKITSNVFKFGFGIFKTFLSVLSPVFSGIFKLAGALGDFLVELTEFSGGKAEIFTRWLERIKTAVEPVREELSRISKTILAFFGIGDAAEISGKKMTTFSDIWDRVKSSVLKSGIGKKLSKSFSQLKSAFSKLGASLKAFWTKVSGYFGEKFRSAVDWIADNVPNAIVTIGEWFSKAIDSIAKYLDKIPEYWNTVKRFFSDIFSRIKESEKLRQFGDNFSKFFKSIYIGAKSWATEGKIPQFVSSIGDFFKRLYNSVAGSEKVKNAYAKVKPVLEGIFDWIKTTWAKIKEAFVEFFSADSDDDASLEEQAKKRFSAFENLGEWLKETWEKLKGIFSNLVGNLKSNFERFKNLNWGLIGVAGVIGGIIIAIVAIVGKITGVIHDLAKLKGKGDDSKNTTSFADNFRSIAVSIVLIAASIIAIGMMPPEKLDKGLLTVGAIFGAITLILALSAIFLKGDRGKAVEQVGNAFKSIGIGIGIIAAAIIALGWFYSKNRSAFIAGGIAVGVIAVVLGGIVILMSRLMKSGEKSVQVNIAMNGFIKLALAIAIVALVVSRLGKMSIYELTKGLAAMLVIALGMTLIIKKIPSGGTLKMAGFMGLASAIAILAYVAAQLGKLKTSVLVKGIGALLVIMLAMAVFMKVASKISSDPKSLAVAAGMLILLAAFMFAFAMALKEIPDVDSTRMLAFAGSLSIMLIAISGALAIMNKFGAKSIKDNLKSALSMSLSIGIIIAVLGALLIGLGELNKLTDGYIVDRIKRGGEVLKAISDAIDSMGTSMQIMIGGVTILSAILKKFNMNVDVGTAALITLTMGTVAALAGAIIGGIGELDIALNGGGIAAINHGGAVLRAISNALDAFNGPLGIATGVIVVTGEILSFFDRQGGRNTLNLLKGWINTGLIVATLSTVALLMDAILIGIGSHDMYNGVPGGDIAAIDRAGDVLRSIGTALEAFDSPLGLATVAIVGASEALSILDRGGKHTIDLLKGWINAGIITSTLATVPLLLAAILEGIGSHDIYSAGVGSSDVEKINRASEVLDAVGGALDSFNGVFGTATLAIAGVGEAIGFLGAKGTLALALGGIDAMIITGTFGAIVTIGTACLKGLGTWDENSGGDLIDDIQRAGEVLSSVGGALSSFVSGWREEGATSIAESIKIIGDSKIKEEDTTNAIEAAQAVSEFIDQWSNLSFFDVLKASTFGVLTTAPFRNFCGQTRQFATAINDFGTAIKIVDANTIPNTQIALTAAGLIGDFFTEITSDKYDIEGKSSGWKKFWEGEGETESFISYMGDLAEKIKTFGEKTSGLSEGSFIEDATAVTDFVRDLASIATFDKDTHFDSWVLDSVVVGIGNLNTAITGLQKAFDDGNIDVSEVGIFGEAVASIASSVNILNSVDADSFRKKLGELTSAFSSSEEDDGADLFSGINLDTAPILEACASAVTSIRSYSTKFKSAGLYLAQGLAQGMRNGLSTVRSAGSTLANAAYNSTKVGLDENSPSKKGAELGRYFDLGVAQGMNDYTHAVRIAGEGISDSAITSVQKSLSGMNDILTSGTNADPIIRPVVDLTNVSDGANAIRGMLSGGSTISVGANLSGAAAVSSSIKAARENQNGIGSGNIDNSKVNTNSVNLSGNNFYVRSEQDIHSLASEIASLTYQQQRGLGYT